MSEEKESGFYGLPEILRFSDVAKMLEIPASTLRYWDKEGLVRFERRLNNDYRQVSRNTLMTLLDVLDYRNMGISIEQIKQTPHMQLADLQALLGENEQALRENMRRMEETLAKIRIKTQALQRVQTLSAAAPERIRAQMPAIYAVDLNNAAEIKQYLVPMQAVDVLMLGENAEWRAGLWAQRHRAAQDEQLLRSADAAPMPYLHGLLCFGRDGRHNLKALLEWADADGEAAHVIAQYLCTARHADYGLCDYHECWIVLKAE